MDTDNPSARCACTPFRFNFQEFFDTVIPDDKQVVDKAGIITCPVALIELFQALAGGSFAFVAKSGGGFSQEPTIPDLAFTAVMASGCTFTHTPIAAVLLPDIGNA
jgi:hypothetical protein